jgi:hypothetical protein
MGMRVDHALLARLYDRPHPSVADVSTAGTIHHARIAHHLLDMASIPRGTGDDAGLDARVFLAMSELVDLRERLNRIREQLAD